MHIDFLSQVIVNNVRYNFGRVGCSRFRNLDVRNHDSIRASSSLAEIDSGYGRKISLRT